MSEANWGTVEEVRRLNRELDERITRLVADIKPDELTVDPGSGDWCLAENLGHIGEFPRFFARQLAQWMSGERTVMGRVAEHCPDRNDALVSAPSRTLREAREEIQESFALLADVMNKLRAEDLDAPLLNVKYGEEPMREYLHRYVIGHKAAHVEQLVQTLTAVRSSGPKG